MSKQTALQFFLTGLIDLNIGELLVDDKWIQFKELYQQAKEMEREQRLKDFQQGFQGATDALMGANQSVQNKTYGKEAGHE